MSIFYTLLGRDIKKPISIIIEYTCYKTQLNEPELNRM